MRELPRISETEWDVMKAAWAHSPCSSQQIIEALMGIDHSWHPRTIKTYLGRLVRKKALTFTKSGRAYLYRPLVSEEECIDAASKSFLKKFFGGSAKLMILHLVRRNKLPARDIRELSKY